MLILTNCLTETADEGAIKVANSLIKRIKKQQDNVKVISYERQTQYSDLHLPLNKLMISPRLWHLLCQTNENVLYIPFPTRMVPMLVRVCVLSLFIKKRLKVVLTMQGSISPIARILMKLNKAEIVSVSKASWARCAEVIGDRAVRLKVGVDTQKFLPVSREEKMALRRKYNIPEDKFVVLHVGHMQEGRNIQQCLKLDEALYILIVTSSFTKNEQNRALRSRLEEQDNIRVTDSFIPNIEEVYQLADVYFFPVESTSNCIDAPLSVIEAASCDVPVVHTEFGELTEFLGKEGFYPIRSFSSEELNRLIRLAHEDEKKPRQYVLGYDWDRAIEYLCE